MFEEAVDGRGAWRDTPQGKNIMQRGINAIFRAAENTPHGDFQYYYSFLKLVNRVPLTAWEVFNETDLVKWIEINSQEMLDFLWVMRSTEEAKRGGVGKGTSWLSHLGTAKEHSVGLHVHWGLVPADKEAAFLPQGSNMHVEVK